MSEFEEKIARTLETKVELLPYMAELLTDLWDMGAFPQRIVDIFNDMPLHGPDVKVIDFGCGKGAVLITLAREFGFTCLGIEAHQPFLDEAEKYAREHEVEKLCSFVQGDITEVYKNYSNYDILIMTAVGSILGDMYQTINAVRECVKPGGLMFIDDGYVKNTEIAKRENYNKYKTREETLRMLESGDDKIIREVIYSLEEIKQQNERYTNFLKKRTQQLMKRKPDLKPLLTWYLKNQEEECAIIENDFENVLWVIEKR